MPIAAKTTAVSSRVAWLNFNSDTPDVQTEVSIKLSGGGQLNIAHRSVNGAQASEWQELVTWLPPEAHEALARMFASSAGQTTPPTPNPYELVAAAVQREIDDTKQAIHEHEQLLASGDCCDVEGVAETLANLRRNLPAMESELARMRAAAPLRPGDLADTVQRLTTRER